MQINRLFEMVYLLLNQESITAGALAKRFEISTRTIYRDVELLSAAGIPVYMTKGKGGGIALLPGFVLNKTVLTDSEKADILAALHAVDVVSLKQTNTAIQKLSSLFGSQNANWFEVDFSDWVDAGQEAQLFGLLKTTILQKQRITFAYYSKQHRTVRTVEPLKLCFKGQNWYLYGYCMLRREDRLFKLRRIKELQVLQQTFTRTAPAKLFGQDRVFQDELVTLTLRLPKEMAYRVYDEFAQHEQQPDGSFLVQLTMPQGEWVYRYLATFGEHCEVLAPPQVRSQIKQKLKKTLELYL